MKNEETVTMIIDHVKEEMCDKYCKYTEQSWKSLEENEVNEICEKCPLNRL